MLLASPAVAQCATAGTTITCPSGSNTNSFASSVNGVTMNVQSGAVVSVPPIVGGAALTLDGNGIIVNNQGTIDPTVNGGLAAAASGAVVGNSAGNAININNEAGGHLGGLIDINTLLMDSVGTALLLQNGSGGVAAIQNAGSISASIYGVGTFTAADAPVIVAYGGGAVNFANTGTITGRIGFTAPAAAGVGNTFLNAGTINGSVYLGNSAAGNTFTAVSGSSVNDAGIGTAGTMTVGAATINFAAAGFVDAGSGNGNTLVLQNSATGPGSGSGGAVTTIGSDRYLDFQNLVVNSGTWNLQGNLVSGSATFNDGLANFNSSGTFGSGTIQVNGGAIAASAVGLSLANAVSVANGSNLTLQGNTSFAMNGVISGGGGLIVNNTASTVTLNGVNTFTGLTTVASGASLAVGDSTHATAAVAGDVSVNGGTLAGYGTVQGSVTLSNGGALTPGAASQIGTLTVNGDLTVGNGSQLNFDFGAPGPNLSTPGQSDHVVVGGNLSIGTSTLNINNLGSMGPGLYNLFSWGSTLSITGGGFSPPPGTTLQILTVDKQINLVESQGLTLNEWDANFQASPGQMGGGSGVWSTSSNVWADTTGQYVGPMSPQPGFAIFGGTPGTVTVDNSTGAVSATGMQFMTDGYHLVGDTLTLVGQNGSMPVVRVSGGATATIDNVLAGTSGLNKTDLGTLILTGTNTYTGGTVISGGTLSVSSNANLGDVSGGLTLNGGILQVTGTSFTSTTRAITLGSNGGGFDIADAANTFTVNQLLSGTGGLAKLGAGTLLLTGNNIYGGGTTILAGTLQIGNGGTTGSIAGDVVNNGTLAFDRSDAVTFAQAVSGTGSLVKLGSGTLLLTGTNTYTGATTIQSGTLQLGNGGTTGAIAGDVVDNGTLAFNRSDAVTFAQAVSGTGSVVMLGGGTLVLSGTNTYTGGTTIQSGTLQLGDGGTTGSIAGDVVDNGTLAFNRSDAVTLAQAISGTGSLVKLGGGTLELAGANSYSGPTTVNGGTLAVNSSIALSSLTTVNNGGALSGTGVVGATQVNAGGTLAAGNGTPGSSMTLSSLALASGAQYMVAINPTTSSIAKVSGAATLGGATVSAVYASGSYVAKQYTILNAAGGVSGTFSGLVNTNLPSGFNTTLSYDATHAYLDLALNFVPPPGAGLSINQQNVGTAIVNFFNRNGSIPLVFGALTPSGLTQLSGELGTGAQQATFNAMGQFIGVLTDPFVAGRGDLGSNGSRNAYAEESMAYAARSSGAAGDRGAYAAVYDKAPPPAPTFAQRWSVWAAGFGGSQHTDGNAVVGSNDTRSDLAGVAVGADYQISPDTVAGFALAGGGTSFSVSNLGSGRSDLFQAGAFIRHTVGAAYMTAALAYGWQDITTDRTVMVAGVDALRAEFDANAWSGRLEGGYRLVAQGIGITPYAAGQFTTFEMPAYGETVVSGLNTFALSYNAKSVTDTRSELGLRTDKSFAMDDGILTLRGRLAWAHDFNPDRDVAATFQTLPGASFVVNGAAMAPDAALVSAAVERKWLNGWSAAATFEGEFSDVTRSYAGKGVLSYAF